MNLLERDDSLSALAGWRDAVASQGGCLVWVGGEAGIGKTALMRAFADRRSTDRVLWGACDALYTPQPLAPLYDIARQSNGVLARAVASVATREGMFAAALSELDQAGTVFIFEDLHWADEATLDLLKYLGRRIHRSLGMIVATYRDDEVGAQHPLRFVMGDLPRQSTHRLALGPLTQVAVELLAQRAGRPSQNIHAVTGGNPLFVSEVLASAAGTVPVTVRDAVLARALKLDSRARDIAEFVAVIPGRAEGWLLAGAGRLDETAIDGCLGIGMLRHEDGSLSFRHELVRQALQSSLSAARARKLHDEVLEVLMSRSDVAPARMAHHASGAHRVKEVLRLAPVAAELAAKLGAHREAAAHFQSAIRHAAMLAPDESARLHERLSYECYLIDEIERAIEERRAALDIWRTTRQPLNEGDALRWLSRLSWFAGRRAEANRFAEQAIEVLQMLPRSAALAMAYSNRAQLDMLAYDTASAIRWAERAIAIAQDLADREILAHALNNRGTASLSAGDCAGWTDLVRSLEMALDNGFHEHAARAYTNMASQAVLSRQYDRAQEYLADGIAYCHENDLDSWRLYMLAWSARARFETGDWLSAGRDAEELLRHVKVAPVSRIPALTALGHMRIRRGDPDPDSPLEEARILAESTGELQRLGPLSIARAEARWLQDDFEGAAAALRETYAGALARPAPWLKGELAVWLWRVNALHQVPEDIAEPYALEIAGRWQDAAASWQRCGCPYERALVLGWYGGQPEQREALSILDGLGAAPAVAALRRRLRALGVRGIPRGARESTESHPLGLTRREAQILDLMRAGLRNAAIAKKVYLSTRTVDHHVSSILAKLRVSSRAEAIDVARRAADSSS